MGADMIDFGNKAHVRMPLLSCYQHDGDYDSCACGRRKLKSDRLCSRCREKGL